MKKVLSVTGVALLAFLATTLAILGFMVSFRTYDSVGLRNASVPFDGFLMTTVGIGIAMAACHLATKLGAAKGIEAFVGVFLSFFGIPAFLTLIISVWYEHKCPGGLPPAGLVWFALAVLETMAAVVWLVVKDRRAKKASVTVRNPD